MTPNNTSTGDQGAEALAAVAAFKALALGEPWSEVSITAKALVAEWRALATRTHGDAAISADGITIFRFAAEAFKNSTFDSQTLALLEEALEADNVPLIDVISTRSMTSRVNDHLSVLMADTAKRHVRVRAFERARAALLVAHGRGGPAARALAGPLPEAEDELAALIEQHEAHDREAEDTNLQAAKAELVEFFAAHGLSAFPEPGTASFVLNGRTVAARVRVVRRFSELAPYAAMRKSHGTPTRRPASPERQQQAAQ